MDAVDVAQRWLARKDHEMKSLIVDGYRLPVRHVRLVNGGIEVTAEVVAPELRVVKLLDQPYRIIGEDGYPVLESTITTKNCPGVGPAARLLGGDVFTLTVQLEVAVEAGLKGSPDDRTTDA